MLLSSVKSTKKLGNLTEEMALKYLLDNGLTLIKKNFSHRIGEIDIIMQDKTAIVFIEVRYRKNTNFGFPEETVTYKKQKKIKSTALIYISRNPKFKNAQPRFDVVAMTPNDEELSINWIKNAF
ncbi:hypothetical protein MNBD_GAMMA22-1466 [hydrothermal vent metagenome]|uniref:Uncharacterized protein n=1 Tax=hydrothermal vent metagenome TaxID=652676 RepID=A0A3B1ACA9_9ZZZZ